MYTTTRHCTAGSRDWTRILIPGFLKIKSRDFSGFWYSTEDDVYKEFIFKEFCFKFLHCRPWPQLLPEGISMHGVQTKNSPLLLHCNFDLANSLYGISKTISSRRSAEVSKSSKRNPLRYPCRERLKERIFMHFHCIFWKRTFFEGVPVWEVWEVLVPNVYLGV